MGFRITRELLPPLTNTTRRARYYSFFCWVYWTFAEHMRRLARPQITDLEQKAWRTRLENALRTATGAEPDYTSGLIGYNSRIPLESGAAYPIGTDIDITAWEAEYYKPSWFGFGLGHLKGDIVVVSPTRGVPLARAFDARVRAADPSGSWYQELVSTKQEIPLEAMHGLTHALALRNLEDQDEAERSLLVDRLFHLHANADPDPLTRADWTRSMSLTLILDLVQQGEGAVTGADTAHYVFGTGRFPDGQPYAVPPVLRETYSRWERYQEREQEKLAIYCYWHEVLLALRQAGGAGVPTNAIVHHVLTRTGSSEAVRTHLGPNALDLPVGKCISTLVTGLDKDGETDLVTQALTRSALDLSRPARAGEATLLLLLLTAKWKRIASSLPASIARVHTDAAPSELPLPLIAREILAKENQSLGRLVRHAVEQWVLAQSLRVALEKWAANQDRFFIARDADGYRIVRSQAPRYLAYDPPRIDSCLQILADLRLVTRDGAGYVVTQAGETLRNEALDFHQDRLGVP